MDKWFQDMLEIQDQGRGIYDVTERLGDLIGRSGIKIGLCHVFLHHTSASLIICENADPTVRTDLEAFMARVVPDGDPLFKHTAEGADDMPAHVRNVLTQTELTIPITAGQMTLGTWQGVYLWEHRSRPYTRRMTITIRGDDQP